MQMNTVLTHDELWYDALSAAGAQIELTPTLVPLYRFKNDTVVHIQLNGRVHVMFHNVYAIARKGVDSQKAAACLAGADALLSYGKEDGIVTVWSQHCFSICRHTIPVFTVKELKAYIGERSLRSRRILAAFAAAKELPKYFRTMNT